MIHVYKKQHGTKPFLLNIIHVPVIKYNSHMTVTLTTVSSIFFNQQNTFGKVIDHVNNNPTIYQLYGPQSGLEKNKK